MRAQVLSGAGKVSTRLFHNKIIAVRSALERDQFALVIACDGKRRCAPAAVFLFGTLSYRVTLNDDYQGLDVLKTIGFDGSTRSDCLAISGSIVAEYAVIAEVNSPKTIWGLVGRVRWVPNACSSFKGVRHPGTQNHMRSAGRNTKAR